MFWIWILKRSVAIVIYRPVTMVISESSAADKVLPILKRNNQRISIPNARMFVLIDFWIWVRRAQRTVPNSKWNVIFPRLHTFTMFSFFLRGSHSVWCCTADRRSHCFLCFLAEVTAFCAFCAEVTAFCTYCAFCTIFSTFRWQREVHLNSHGVSVEWINAWQGPCVIVFWNELAHEMYPCAWCRAKRKDPFGT